MPCINRQERTTKSQVYLPLFVVQKLTRTHRRKREHHEPVVETRHAARHRYSEKSKFSQEACHQTPQLRTGFAHLSTCRSHKPPYYKTSSYAPEQYRQTVGSHNQWTGLDWTGHGLTLNALCRLFQCRTEAKHAYSLLHSLRSHT